jgi:nucleoside 2-deoxyribosyltransferase
MQNSGVFDGLLITCPQCGRYELKGVPAIFASFEWAPKLRSALSCAARQAAEAGQPLRITSTEAAAEFAEPHMHTRVSDNQERLLREVAKRAGRPNIGASFSLTNDFPLIDCYNKEEFLWYIEWLETQKLVFQTGAGPATAVLTLSMDGWNRVQPLPRPGGLPGRCFVAMWFSEETRAAYEKGIEPAVSDAGFKPIRIDRKEHNNEIPDEIIAEIRNAQFMVADFTGQRSGVYYEAGFAMGLGRPVVWSCRKDEIGKLHFDTNHKNHINWQTPEELRERLYKRIRATILEQS